MPGNIFARAMIMYVIFAAMTCGLARASPAKLPPADSRDSRFPLVWGGDDQIPLRTSSFRLAFSMIPPIPETEARGELPKPIRPIQYCSSNSTRHENICMRRLSNKVTMLEKTISSLLSAIVYADDIALNERLSIQMGRVYKDADLQSSRSPRMLRQSVQNIANAYHLYIAPSENNWIPQDILSEICREEGVE